MMNQQAVRKTLFEQAEKIIERAANTNSLIGVFAVGGRLKGTKATTALFDEGCKKQPHRLVGCYDGNGDPERMVDDALETVGTWPEALPKAA